MKVNALMRTDVQALSPDDAVGKAWRSMLEHGLTALPVADAQGHLIGMLTEADLLVRRIPRRRVRWWHPASFDTDRSADDYRKTVGTTVQDLMTRSPALIGHEASRDEAAALMHARGVRTLPVIADGVLVGIVVRADLIGDLEAPAAGGFASDSTLVTEMRRRMSEESWASAPTVHVWATRGVLQVYGLVDSRAQQAALLTMARAVPGCLGVEDHLLLRTELPRRLV